MNDNNGWMMEEMARLHREEWLRNAELYRMEKIALSGLPRKPGLVERFLYRAGHIMAAWGARLEERYGCAGELAPATAGNRR